MHEFDKCVVFRDPKDDGDDVYDEDDIVISPPCHFYPPRLWILTLKKQVQVAFYNN